MVPGKKTGESLRMFPVAALVSHPESRKTSPTSVKTQQHFINGKHADFRRVHHLEYFYRHPGKQESLHRHSPYAQGWKNPVFFEKGDAKSFTFYDSDFGTGVSSVYLFTHLPGYRPTSYFG